MCKIHLVNESVKFLKVFIAVFICKVLYFIGKRIGRGSSLPGKVVLKIFPGILGMLKLPETVIAVTGSNGKTSASELIVHVLEMNGKVVGWNHEGSNQTEGIATLLLRMASFSGIVMCDVIVMECDERYAKNIFENVHPTILLITNLCRDQLTRNGHPEFIEDCLLTAINAAGDGVQLVLNADDPYVSALALNTKTNVLYFGLSSSDDCTQNTGVYDDGAFCPVCKSRMVYSYRITGHLGDYKCDNCGLKRNNPDVDIGSLGDSIAGSYNICSAVAVAGTVGIKESNAVSALDGYELKGGRTVKLTLGERKGLLLISKHENSFAYDNSLSWIIKQKKPCTVIILVDSISRKYYTSETSWLWDIDFDLLTDENIKKIVLAGRYVNELAARFAMSAVSQEKIVNIADLSGLRELVEKSTSGDIYVLTCFSDKKKLLDEFS